MQNIDREDIQIISQHSNCSEKTIETVLKENVYHDKTAWLKFLQLLFMSLGICFATAGILFFFAYNWADLHKFLKIGMIEGLLVVSLYFVLFSKIDLKFKNIILLGASMLVGVLFAVFGQIYQTGANAYDFFWGWTMAVTLWVVMANFPALWLLFLLLINTTILLYAKQVAADWDYVFINTLLFTVNVAFLIAFIFLKNLKPSFNSPSWLTNIIALAALYFSTFGIISRIWGEKTSSFWTLFLLVSIVYILGTRYAFQSKNIFYLAVIPFSVIMIITAFLAELTNSGGGIFLFIAVFVIASVTLLIKGLVDLQKKWTNE